MAKRDDKDDELLAAYVDGVGELTPEERKHVEAKLGELDVDGTRSVIDQLRALPPEGNEPDWRALERRIANAVDEVKTPPVSWRGLVAFLRNQTWKRWFVPAGALVMTAAALLLWIRHSPEQTQHVAVAPVIRDAAVPAPVTPAPAAQPTEVYLDGHFVDVSDVDEDALLDDGDAPDAVTADDDGLLPAGDLGWVDQLDDHAMDRAERWLERKKS